MIVIGADTHKRTHMLVGVDAGTGQLLGDRQIAASDDGHRDAVRWARRASLRARVGDRGLPTRLKAP